MGPAAVYQMRPEYKRRQYNNFRQNLLALRKKISEEKKRGDFEASAIAHDKAIHPTAASVRGVPRWSGSEAERKLLLAMDNGLDKQMNPQQLHSTEPAFLEFPLDVFRNHIHQERRRRTEAAYWKSYWASKSK